MLAKERPALSESSTMDPSGITVAGIIATETAMGLVGEDVAVVSTIIKGNRGRMVGKMEDHPMKP